MDAMVSARVPVEVRDQVNDTLKAMGATPTQLINAAYRYVLEVGEIPAVPMEVHPSLLSAERLSEVMASIEATSCAVPASFFDGRTDEQILEDELRGDYEALA